MLESSFGVPPPIGYVICAVAVVPLVTHGFTFISRLQLWSQPVWIVLQILPFLVVGASVATALRDWTTYPGVTPSADGHFNIVLFGAAALGGGLADHPGWRAGRFPAFPARPSAGPAEYRLVGGHVGGRPGWILVGLLKLLAGSFLACLAVAEGVAPMLARQPNTMYEDRLPPRGPVTDRRPRAGDVLRRDLAAQDQPDERYAGSIGWSNFFSRLTHSHPGRVVWLVFNIAIALLLMELGIYQAIEHTLVLYSAVAAAWVGALVSDLVINKPLGYSPAHIEFKRATSTTSTRSAAAPC